MRPHREFWQWLGRLFLSLFAFFAAAALAYVIKDSQSLLRSWWMLAALVSFIAAQAAFFGAVRSWPVPTAAGPARPGFPALELDIHGAGTIQAQRDADSGLAVNAQLRSFTVTMRNTEAAQRASVSVLLYVKLVPGSWGRVGEAVCPAPDWALPPSLGLHPMTLPADLPPGGQASGQLVYEVPGYYTDKLAGPPAARLELWDHVSSRRMSMPAEIGSHDRGTMVGSSGSAEILGPEYETQPGQTGDQEGAAVPPAAAPASPPKPALSPDPPAASPASGPRRPA